MAGTYFASRRDFTGIGYSAILLCLALLAQSCATISQWNRPSARPRWAPRTSGGTSAHGRLRVDDGQTGAAMAASTGSTLGPLGRPLALIWVSMVGIPPPRIESRSWFNSVASGGMRRATPHVGCEDGSRLGLPEADGLADAVGGLQDGAQDGALGADVGQGGFSVGHT